MTMCRPIQPNFQLPLFRSKVILRRLTATMSYKSSWNPIAASRLNVAIYDSLLRWPIWRASFCGIEGYRRLQSQRKLAAKS